jgi:hypothetical protein
MRCVKGVSKVSTKCGEFRVVSQAPHQFVVSDYILQICYFVVLHSHKHPMKMPKVSIKCRYAKRLQVAEKNGRRSGGTFRDSKFTKTTWNMV